MNEGEKDRLTRRAVRQAEFGAGVDAGWESLHSNAIGSIWGRFTPDAEVAGVDPWVLGAEMSR
jgi:hypothetical protein